MEWWTLDWIIATLPALWLVDHSHMTWYCDLIGQYEARPAFVMNCPSKIVEWSWSLLQNVRNNYDVSQLQSKLYFVVSRSNSNTIFKSLHLPAKFTIDQLRFKPSQCLKFNFKGILSMLFHPALDWLKAVWEGAPQSVICEISSLLWHCIDMTMGWVDWPQCGS